MAFPFALDGLEDHRKFYFETEGPISSEKPNIFIQTFNEYPLVLYLMIVSLGFSAGLIVYARCVILRRRRENLEFRDEPTVPEIPEQKKKGSYARCVECKKSIELAFSELSLIENIKCDGCQNKDITIED